ncbi:MAG TPA: hypothetical protein VGC24_10410 [Burkholderiaceae bacterium]
MAYPLPAAPRGTAQPAVELYPQVQSRESDYSTIRNEACDFLNLFRDQLNRATSVTRYQIVNIPSIFNDIIPTKDQEYESLESLGLCCSGDLSTACG